MIETGYLVSVNRLGQSVILDIAELTEQELFAFFESIPQRGLVNWGVTLVQWIQKNQARLEPGATTGAV